MQKAPPKSERATQGQGSREWSMVWEGKGGREVREGEGRGGGWRGREETFAGMRGYGGGVKRGVGLGR